MAAVVLFAAAVPQLFAQPNPDLERVLNEMDKAAAGFHTTEASFVWDQYQKVVDETDSQKGKVYYRKSSDGVQMAAEITEPDEKYVLFTDSKIQIYQPGIEQVTVYNTGKDRGEVESYLVLGFGGRGHDMLKSFDVKYLGKEKVAGLDAAKLDLTPKSDKVRNNFSHIVLWIDEGRGISIQQQLFQPSGDYRLAKYSDIRVNQKISDSAFKLKTTGKTKVVSPQG
jgi:outer membrane lipoprotein-sorting protein